MHGAMHLLPHTVPGVVFNYAQGSFSCSLHILVVSCFKCRFISVKVASRVHRGTNVGFFLKFIPLTRNDPYRGRTAPLTSKVSFYLLIQQI